MVAGLMEVLGIQQVLTIDLHAPQIEGFFRIPLDNLSGVPTLCRSVRDSLTEGTVVVSQDAGRVRMATEYAQCLGTPVIILHKHRESGTETTTTRVVGDVRDRPCLIIDDMISTGGTITDTVEALLRAGARAEITVAATHALLVKGSQTRLADAAIRKVFITDTIEVSHSSGPEQRVISVAPLLADAIRTCLHKSP